MDTHTKPVPAVVGDWRNGATHCDLHDRDLLESVEPVEQIMTYDELADVRRELFPFASNHQGGNVDYARVMYCPDCRTARAKWITKNASTEREIPNHN